MMDYEKLYKQALLKVILGRGLPDYGEEKPQWKPTKEQLIELDHLISGRPCEMKVVIKLQKQLKSLYEL